MTPAEARALIADGRKHDEAMTPGEWRRSNGGVGVLADHFGASEYVCRISKVTPVSDAAGIAWMRTNLRALLDGYAAEMDEVRRLREVVLRQSGVLTEQQIAACMEVP